PHDATFIFFFGMSFCILESRRTPTYTLFPYTTLFRSDSQPDQATGPAGESALEAQADLPGEPAAAEFSVEDLEAFIEAGDQIVRSEEHTSELQSREKLVCRLLLEKKKLHMTNMYI